MFVTIINDCRDENAMARQATRAASLFKTNITTVGIESFKDLEGAGNIIDIMDAAYGAEGIIMCNIAPRHGRGKKWPNGTPFGYFRHKQTLVVSTIDGYTLSLAKKFGLIETAYVTDLPTVIDQMIEIGQFNAEFRDLVVKSQFRSFDYMPRLAKWLYEGIHVKADILPLDQIEDAPLAVWWVDNFGNCKTTILPEEIDFKPGKKVKTTVGQLYCYARLKDVPNDEPALIIGSSGFGQKRFLEVVIQGKSAAERFGLSSGSVLIEQS
ncbi:MAG: SAM-dependent chlorinase/fluorinase [Patescibacteria group bacterium]|nr:SAM-dependent chlorinase/fluorinase [Patescibacteria group bacterium]